MNKASENGSTLLLVAWAFLVSGIIATFIFYRSEAEWGFVANLEKSAVVRTLAETTLRERLALLVKDKTAEFDSAEDEWYGKGRVETERDGYQITVLIEDEGSKLNLNWLNDQALKSLIGEALSPDPILDWRDSDDDPRSQGGEKEYYSTLTPPYKARNGLFSSVEELKQLKDGEKLYPLLAPEVTVYGKINPAIITSKKKDFVNGLLYACGLDKTEVDRIQDEFINNAKNFKNYDDFRSLHGVTLPIRDKLKTVFHFKANININLVSKNGLKALFKEMKDTDNTVKINDILKGRPYESNDNFTGKFTFPKEQEKEYELIAGKKAANFFTTVSSIIRYRIWVEKGERKYYLETVQERLPGKAKGEWKVYPLSWRSSLNREVPEIPAKPEAEEETVEQ